MLVKEKNGINGEREKRSKKKKKTDIRGRLREERKDYK